MAIFSSFFTVRSSHIPLSQNFRQASLMPSTIPNLCLFRRRPLNRHDALWQLRKAGQQPTVRHRAECWVFCSATLGSRTYRELGDFPGQPFLINTSRLRLRPTRSLKSAFAGARHAEPWPVAVHDILEWLLSMTCSNVLQGNGLDGS